METKLENQKKVVDGKVDVVKVKGKLKVQAELIDKIIAEFKIVKKNYLKFDENVKTINESIVGVQKEVMQKASIKDICGLLDNKPSLLF